MLQKNLKNLINSIGYDISKFSDIDNSLSKINNVKVSSRPKICLDLIKRYPNIPHYYLILAETLHLLCNDDKFYYLDLYGKIRNQWLIETKLDLLNLDFVWQGVFTGSLGNHYGAENLINSHRAKLKKQKNIFCLMGSNKPRNKTLYNFFNRYINFIEDDFLCANLRSLEKLLVLPLGLCLPMDNSCPFLDLASNITQNNLKDLNLKSNLFDSTDNILEEGHDILNKINITRDDWFVTLHMREPTYRGETYKNNNSNWRNVRIEDYIESIENITSKGGYVFRMGDNQSSRLPKIKGLIDYAHSEIKSDYMDVFLGAKSKFCIATSSGFYHIPMLFGKPVIFGGESSET